MKFLKFLTLVLPLTFLSSVNAQDDYPSGSSSFQEEMSEEQKEDVKRQKLNDGIQEEEEQVDSFGNDIYNENVDPRYFEVEEAEEVQEIIE